MTLPTAVGRCNGFNYLICVGPMSGRHYTLSPALSTTWSLQLGPVVCVMDLTLGVYVKLRALGIVCLNSKSYMDLNSWHIWNNVFKVYVCIGTVDLVVGICGTMYLKFVCIGTVDLNSRYMWYNVFKVFVSIYIQCI